MNFTFLKECEIKDPKMRQEYEEVYRDLERAEESYWKNPRESGILLRGTAEKICGIYNRYYQVGFGAETSLKEFLCYTDNDIHNEMVSHFLSAIRTVQRDRLNKLRVLGDDCILGEETPQGSMSLEDRMLQNAERMMDTMMETLIEMYAGIHGRTDFGGHQFNVKDLPGQPAITVDGEASQNGRSFFAKFFRKRKCKKG